jgi:hypothetical protein
MADELDEALILHPFVVAQFEFRFIGGPEDGNRATIPSSLLTVNISGHTYRLALARSEDASVPYEYVLVSRSLIPKDERVT